MIKKLTLFTLAIMLLPITFLSSCNSKSDMPAPGATLYTLRDLMDQDPKAVLKQVADMGYVNIEAVNYQDGKFYGMPPAEFKAYLESLGLVPLSVHQGGVTLENADQYIADTKAAGFKYFVIPVPPMGMFTFDRETMSMGMNGTAEEITDILITLAKKCKAAGLELLYHNHNFELKPDANGVVLLDYMLENTDPELVNFQMDLYWMNNGGADPVAYFDRYPGRFKIWHVKDMDDQGRFAPAGTGKIDFKRILAAREKSGMEYYIVEQDMTFDGMEPMEAIQISYDNLKTLGYRE
jgi:sugar phosphate isomerase/epimerase